jgi:hypothetical protein
MPPLLRSTRKKRKIPPLPSLPSRKKKLSRLRSTKRRKKNPNRTRNRKKRISDRRNRPKKLLPLPIILPNLSRSRWPFNSNPITSATTTITRSETVDNILRASIPLII